MSIMAVDTAPTKLLHAGKAAACPQNGPDHTLCKVETMKESDGQTHTHTHTALLGSKRLCRIGPDINDSIGFDQYKGLQ